MAYAFAGPLSEAHATLQAASSRLQLPSSVHPFGAASQRPRASLAAHASSTSSSASNTSAAASGAFSAALLAGGNGLFVPAVHRARASPSVAAAGSRQVQQRAQAGGSTAAAANAAAAASGNDAASPASSGAGGWSGGLWGLNVLTRAFGPATNTNSSSTRGSSSTAAAATATATTLITDTAPSTTGSGVALPSGAATSSSPAADSTNANKPLLADFLAQSDAVEVGYASMLADLSDLAYDLSTWDAEVLQDRHQMALVSTSQRTLAGPITREAWHKARNLELQQMQGSSNGTTGSKDDKDKQQRSKQQQHHHQHRQQDAAAAQAQVVVHSPPQLSDAAAVVAHALLNEECVVEGATPESSLHCSGAPPPPGHHHQQQPPQQQQQQQQMRHSPRHPLHHHHHGSAAAGSPVLTPSVSLVALSTLEDMAPRGSWGGGTQEQDDQDEEEEGGSGDEKEGGREGRQALRRLKQNRRRSTSASSGRRTPRGAGELQVPMLTFMPTSPTSASSSSSAASPSGSPMAGGAGRLMLANQPPLAMASVDESGLRTRGIEVALPSMDESEGAQLGQLGSGVHVVGHLADPSSPRGQSVAVPVVEHLAPGARSPLSPSSSSGGSGSGMAEAFGNAAVVAELGMEQEGQEVDEQHEEEDDGAPVSSQAGALANVDDAPAAWFACDDPVTKIRYIVIQGSTSLEHWQINLQFEPVLFEDPSLGVRVHRGIYMAALKLYDDLLPVVRQHLATSPFASVTFTGHSLGGSLATVIMLIMVARGVLPPDCVSPAYTFGAPAVFCGGAGAFSPPARCQTCGLDCPEAAHGDHQHQLLAQSSATPAASLLPADPVDLSDDDVLSPWDAAAAASDPQHRHHSPSQCRKRPRGLFQALGLGEEHIVNVIMHRDIVPRAFVCDYSVVADLLVQWMPSFKGLVTLQGGANAHRSLYSFLGRVAVLQPDTSCPFVNASDAAHPHLPSAAGLYRMVAPAPKHLLRVYALDGESHVDLTDDSDMAQQHPSVPAPMLGSIDGMPGDRDLDPYDRFVASGATARPRPYTPTPHRSTSQHRRSASASPAPSFAKAGSPAPGSSGNGGESNGKGGDKTAPPTTLREAVQHFMNNPHPLSTLFEYASYGPQGSISRYHNPRNYVVGLLALVQRAPHQQQQAGGQSSSAMMASLTSPPPPAACSIPTPVPCAAKAASSAAAATSSLGSHSAAQSKGFGGHADTAAVTSHHMCSEEGSSHDSARRGTASGAAHGAGVCTPGGCSACSTSTSTSAALAECEGDDGMLLSPEARRLLLNAPHHHTHSVSYTSMEGLGVGVSAGVSSSSRSHHAAHHHGLHHHGSSSSSSGGHLPAHVSARSRRASRLGTQQHQQQTAHSKHAAVGHSGHVSKGKALALPQLPSLGAVLAAIGYRTDDN